MIQAKQTSPIVIVLAAMVAFAPLSIDMYLPALPGIASDLAAADWQVQWAISIFLAGFSVGMLLYGPLSDRYGRKRLLLAGVGIYVLASMGCMLARNVDQLIAFRLCQALGGSAASVLARAIVRDLFEVRAVAIMLSWMHVITMVATLLAPLIGSLMLEFSGWRSIFFVLFLIAGVSGTAGVLVLPESHPSDARSHSVVQAFKAYGEVARNRVAMACVMTMGFSFGGMFAYITLSPFVYITHFGVSPKMYAWLFAMNIFGIMVVTYFNTRWLRTHRPERMLRPGASIAALSGLGMLVMSETGMGGLPVLVGLLLVYVSVTGMMGANAIASLFALYPGQAGAASGLATSTQFGLGMLLSALGSLLHDGSPSALCTVVAASGVLCRLSLGMAGRTFGRPTSQ